MANSSKDIDRILSQIKSKQEGAKPSVSAEHSRLAEIIKAETTAAKAVPAQNTVTAAPQQQTAQATPENTVAKEQAQGNTAREIENEFLSRLAVALKENPNVSDLVEEVPPEGDPKHEKTVKVNAASYVDDKFVDFFTQSIAVPKAPSTAEIIVERKKRGFFKKKYITDSLSLSIPKEEVDKRQQKVAKASTQEVAKNLIANAVKTVKPVTEEFVPAAETAKKTQPQPKQPMPKAEAVQPKTQPQAQKPADAESIVAALRAKKAAVMHTVAQTEAVKPQAEFLSSKTEEVQYSQTAQTAAEKTEAVQMPLEDTGYIPSLTKTEETAELFTQNDITGYVPAVPEEQTEKERAITGEITSLFARFGKAGADTKETDIEGETEEEEVFEEFVAENDFITQQFSDDPEEIYEELNSFKFTLMVRVAISAVCAVVLFYLNFAAAKGWPVPAAINPIAQPVLFYLVNLVFYVIALVGFLPTVANGITGFVKAPTSDAFLVVPSILSLGQLVAAIATAKDITAESTTLFAGFTVVALGFNALGKIVSANTILRNLDLAQVPEGINAGYIVKDFEEVKRLARTLEEKNPQILVSRKTGYISNFISGGFSTHKSEKTSKILSCISLVVVVACFALSMLNGAGAVKALFAATGASVFMLPLSHALISSVPGAMMQGALNQVGALVNGWQGIYQLSDATHVTFDAKHLFPKGCVVLHGIKTFEKERLDLAILYAASIAIEKCDNLRSVFMNVIDGKKDMLYPLESCEYRVGQGYVAWIEGNRVIMGNRHIMEEFSVALPPLSVEARYISEGKRPVYLSVNGKLFGMFVVSYHSDHAVKENLLHLVEQGKNVILQSNDFNVDSPLLETVYNLPEDTVQVLNKNETTLLLGYTEYAESTDCAMAHLDSLHSLSAGFFGADSAKRAAATCSLVQIISVAVGAVLSLVFTWSQTIWAIPLTSVLLLGLGWLGLCLMRALATKYL